MRLTPTERADRQIRRAAFRWRAIGQLLDRIEIAMATTARLDGQRAAARAHHGRTPLEDYAVTYGSRAQTRIDTAMTWVDRELDRLTAERLRLDLARKQARDARRPNALAGIPVVAVLECDSVVA